MYQGGIGMKRRLRIDPVYLQVSDKELRQRRKRVLDEARRRGLDALCFFNPISIFYLTRFRFLTTERPICIILLEDDVYCFVPHLERQHVAIYAFDVEIETYPEYPGREHPMNYLKKLFLRLNLSNKVIGVDMDGAPEVSGYHGPSISELLSKACIQPARDIVETMRMVKSPEEIALMRESAKWSSLAHRLLQEFTRPGLYENEVSLLVRLEATRALIRMYGEKDRSFVGVAEIPDVGFRGQIGKFSSIPHSLTRNAVIRKGDVLITGAEAVIGGYRVELERTLIVGRPSKKQERYFNLMVQCQDAVFKVIKPGVTCAQVDRVAIDFYKENGLIDAWPSHIGHSIGLERHEAPYLDEGEDTVLQPGMIFTVEPGMMFPGFAGFRHSDTVLVTESGMEMLTYYPRDLDSLIVSC